MKGLKYFAEYSDFDGQEYKIEIWVEGFTGVATEVTAGGNPVTVDRNKDVSETYLGGIVPTFYRFEFVTDTNFSTRVFDSEKYGDVVIQHYKGTNLQFNAIVQPFVGMEQDLPDGLSVFTLSGECGLEYLKNKKFANPTDTNVRLIDLIQEAVDLIPYVEKFGFKVFDNTALYNGVSRINSNQNFLEARINRKTFTDYTYYDVLLNLVANRNEIYFDNGFWWVRNLSELSELYTTSNTGTLVTYDENGDFLTSIPNYRPSKSIIRQAGGSFGKLFSQKNVVVKRIEPERINYVLNGSFDQGSTNFVPNNWTAGSEAFSSVLGADFFRFVESVYTPTLTSDNAYIQSTAITWEPFGALFASPVREPQKLTFRTNVEIGTGISACRFQIIATSGNTTVYLTTDLAWTTTPTIIQKKPDASGQIEFDIPQPPNELFTTIGNFDQPISYNVSMRLFRSERAFETTVGTATYFTQYNEVSFFKDSLYTQFFDEYIGKSDYRQDENSDRENPLELETIIASQNSFPYRHGSLFDAEGVAANGFGSVNSLSGTIYNIYLATSYLNVTSKRLTYYQGSSFEHFDFSDVLLIDGIHFRVSNYSHDIKSKTVQFKAVELSYSSGFILDINKIKSDVEKAITVVNNIGLIPQDYNFTSSTNFDGRTSFGMRPDVRHVSASLTEMFLRATPTATDSVSIKPGVEGIELLTPPPLATAPETLATREWAANGLETKYLQLDTTYTNGNFPGRLSWDADHDLMFLGLEDDYTAKVPQDSVWSCIAAEAITKGQLVYASGTVGSSGKIQASRFIANGTIPSRFVIGVATRTVAQGETFHALRAGVLRGLDTSAYTAGQDLWASSTVAGGFQTTAPTAPNPKMSVAFVITSHANVGELAVRIIPSLGVSLLDDVQVTSPATNQLLRYNNNRWENFTPDFASVPTAGTVNRIPRFSAARTLADSSIFEASGRVIVGNTDNTVEKLQVEGQLAVSSVNTTNITSILRPAIRITSASSASLASAWISQRTVTGNAWALDIVNESFRLKWASNDNITNNVNAVSLFILASPTTLTFGNSTITTIVNNKLLINQTVDTGERLQVTGTARITSTLTVPTIGNSAGVSAQNTWTFASNVNVPLTPSASTHATSKSYVDNLVATGIKEGIPVWSISLTNITLSGTQTISGVALVAGDRVLVAGQTTASQNGVYIVASGAWTRATDSDTDSELRGYQYLITAGTFINAKYRNTNESAITVGTTAITYVVSQGAETDPIFSASPAASITQQFINNWNANYAVWGELTPEIIFANRTTTNLPEGDNLYFTDARARSAISAGTGISYNSSTGVISSLITQYTDSLARAALSFAEGPAGYNSSTGVISIPTTTNHIVEGSNLFYTNARSRLALSFAAGSGAYNSGTGVITIPTQTSHLTNNSGFITSSALSGYVPTTRTINGLDLSTNRVLTTSNIGEGTNLYFTDTRSRASLSFIAGSGAYNSTTGAITIPTNTNHVAEGSNLYYTDARSRSAISVGAGLSYNSGTGVITNTITQYTDTLARLSLSFVAGVGNYSSVSGVITIPTLTTHIEEGTRQYFTDARARTAISLTTSGTSGVATYNSSTGVLNIPNYTIINPITGVLTAGRIPVATAAGAIADSNILQVSNRILLNTTTDNNRLLQVNGQISVVAQNLSNILSMSSPAIRIINNSSTALANTWISQITAGGNAWAIDVLNETFRIKWASAENIASNTNAITQIITATNTQITFGGTGINTVVNNKLLVNSALDSGETLQVNGSAKITSMAAGASTDELVTVNASGVLRKIAYSTFVPSTRTINGLDLSANRVLTTTNIGEGTNLYFTNARARSAISLTVGTTLTAPTYNASTGVLNLPATLLQDRQFTDVAAGLRQLRSIDYYENRMDFGFDKVLDVPYLYYDKNGTRYVNYMNGNGVFVHVDNSGNERQYLRVGDIGTTVPNLQQVSEVGKSSTIKLQWNGIDYATVNDIVAATVPTLQQVSQQGSNSTIRLSHNGQNYATLADLQTITVPTPTLSSVLASGNNAFGTAIQFGNAGFIQNITNVLYGDGIFLGTTSQTCHLRLQGTTFEISGLQGARVDSVSGGVLGKLFLQSGGNNPITLNGRDYAFGQTPTLITGAKYVFQWDGSKFIIVNA